jgi:transposase
MKKTHSAMLKLKVALAALKGEPITEICQKYEVAESLVHKWKKKLKDDGSMIFSNGKKQKASDDHEKAKLYQRIGELTTELDFLKKVVEG